MLAPLDLGCFGNIATCFTDFMLVLKIFLLLTIISFVRNHIGTGSLSWVVIGLFAWFILFDYWVFFGGIFLLYTLLAFGVGQLIIDYMFVSQGFGAQPQPGEPESPMGHGMDVLNRMEAAKRMQGALRPKPPIMMGR